MPEDWPPDRMMPDNWPPERFIDITEFQSSTYKVHRILVGGEWKHFQHSFTKHVTSGLESPEATEALVWLHDNFGTSAGWSVSVRGGWFIVEFTDAEHATLFKIVWC